MAMADTSRRKFRGDRLQAAREALKATTKGKKGSQAWLAARVGAHVTSVSDWERGANEPSARYIAAICAIPELSLSPSVLLGSEDDEEAAPMAPDGMSIAEMLESLILRVVDAKVEAKLRNREVMS